MAGIIKLDDGSDLCASNLGLSGALECIARAVSDIDTPLARWLLDVAQRPGGLMDFDLRGLSTARRAAFWAGVDRANAGVADWDQEACFSPAIGVLRSIHERRDVRWAASQEHVPEINLDELWFDDGIA